MREEARGVSRNRELPEGLAVPLPPPDKVSARTRSAETAARSQAAPGTDPRWWTTAMTTNSSKFQKKFCNNFSKISDNEKESIKDS